MAKQPVKKKDKKIEVKLDPDLYDQANKYADGHGVSLSAIIRALLRIVSDPQDPKPLPPGVDQEKKRPPRRSK